MKHSIIVTVFGSVLAFGTGSVYAGPGDDQGGGHDKTASALPACPVVDEPINFAVHVTTDEGPVFFCCRGCDKKYLADPAKFAAKVAVQRKALANRPKTQVICPVSGEPADPEFSADHNGEKVYFCCNGCVKKFKKNAAKYKAGLANSYTFQTKCPVTGEDIEPQTFTTLVSGTHIYFCCKGCVKKLTEDPDKYLPNLKAQGFTLKPDAMTHDK